MKALFFIEGELGWWEEFALSFDLGSRLSVLHAKDSRRKKSTRRKKKNGNRERGK